MVLFTQHQRPKGMTLGNHELPRLTSSSDRASTAVGPPGPLLPRPHPPTDDLHARWAWLLDAAQRRLDDLAVVVPNPFDLQVFTATVADRLDVRIRLVPVRMSGFDGSACMGAHFREGRTHYCTFVTGMSAMHALHNGCHEVSHVVWGHKGTLGGPVDRDREDEAEAMATVLLRRCEPARPTARSSARERAAAQRFTRAWR
jgi:hypothetical protein